ncbi:hypothetical protein D3C86_2252900 [compost metagenome]
MQDHLAVALVIQIYHDLQSVVRRADENFVGNNLGNRRFVVLMELNIHDRKQPFGLVSAAR